MAQIPINKATRQVKEITTPIAKELAEYLLLQHDIKSSFDTIKLWYEKYAGRKATLTAEERLIALSLFRNSIIMFVGCFDKSAPLYLKESDIYKTEDGGIIFFNWLKDIRDSYAAHKFGPLRQCVVGVIPNEDGVVIGWGHHVQIYAGPAPVADAKEQFLSFISKAGRYVDGKITDLSQQMVEAGKKMSRAEVAALNIARPHDVEPGQIRKSRDNFRRSIPKGDKG